MSKRDINDACVVAALIFSPVAGATSAGRPPVETWGRPGVSFEQYRADSVECAKRGFFRDVTHDEPAKKFVRGFRTADDDLNKADIGGASWDRWRDSILRTQPDRLKRQVHAIQMADVERCLSDKGYRKFRLSLDEARELARFRAGSDDRHRYLYRLASRPH